MKLIGRRCSGHDLCVPLPREVPPELRCQPEQPQGYGAGGGVSCGCQMPKDLDERVLRELREDLQECRRRGYVLIEAA
ncbi:MAG TPA: hypothetical protein PKI27_16390 [Dermatophilaceae bacterium]|nr:hypothetical protein [Dermatophilaceae bacterium]